MDDNELDDFSTLADGDFEDEIEGADPDDSDLDDPDLLEEDEKEGW